MTITVDAGDGRIIEFPSVEAANQFFSNQQLAEPERGFGNMVYENVVGRGEVDTPGERFGQAAGDVLSSIGSGIARGVTSVADLPALVGQLGQAGVVRAYKAITGEDPPPEFLRELSPELPLGIEPTRAYAGEAARSVAPGVMDFEPETTAGEFAQTGAEFTTGAGLTGGAGSAIRYGLLPGLASEAAGQATEGTAAEPYARAGAALGTSLLATPRPTSVGRRVTRADPERAEAAESLMRQGVRPTAGQTLDAESLMRAEGTLGPSAAQLDDFTKAALRTAGNTTAKRATPEVLKSTQSQITQGMNKILDVDVPVTPTAGQKVLQIADDYFVQTPGRDMPIALRKVAEELSDLATTPGAATVPAKTMRKWRSTLGSYTTSNQETTREAAHTLREVIDDLTESALTQLGRGDDIAKLANLRRQYRNFLTIADASTRGGREGASGLLTPERLSSAAKRVMGRTNYATGRATDLADLSRRGEMIIGAAPTVKPGGIRDVATAAGLGSAGAYGGFMGGGPIGGIAGGLAGAALPSVGSAAMRSGPVQSAIMRPGQFGGSVATLPGLLSNEPNQ